LLLLLLMVLLLGQTGFAVLFNALTGEFTSALAAKDADRFWTSIIQCLGHPGRRGADLRLLLLRPRQTGPVTGGAG
jgi:hypothetical protein